MSVKEGAETQLRFVGRLQMIDDALCTAISEMRFGDAEERHAGDLLSIARDSIKKAALMLWGSAPEIEQRTEINGVPDPIEAKRIAEMPFTLLP
jgi:hypothetical protein